MTEQFKLAYCVPFGVQTLCMTDSDTERTHPSMTHSEAEAINDAHLHSYTILNTEIIRVSVHIDSLCTELQLGIFPPPGFSVPASSSPKTTRR